jgi:hypothetical protein
VETHQLLQTKAVVVTVTEMVALGLLAQIILAVAVVELVVALRLVTAALAAPVTL